MEFEGSDADRAILEELGRRIARYRLNRNLTQDTFALEAGVSRATLARLERGHSTNLSNLIRVLRMLHLVENLESLIPEPPPSPVQQIATRKQHRKRASKTIASESAVEAKDTPWQWGEEK
jgi:putative transcriptional regulator